MAVNLSVNVAAEFAVDVVAGKGGCSPNEIVVEVVTDKSKNVR